ncbi:MAG: hypothetical protein K0U98_09090 [Deltaproteobacteria bacterium]|nr:hypothetical protein [Deltaproteobacteria bacterium]
MDELLFQGSKETLSHGVIPTIAAPNHAASNPSIRQSSLIGADRFFYDRVGRLTLGTVRQAGAGHKETYPSDGFDNMLKRVRNQSQTDTFYVDNNNRLLGINDDLADRWVGSRG